MTEKVIRELYTRLAFQVWLEPNVRLAIDRKHMQHDRSMPIARQEFIQTELHTDVAARVFYIWSTISKSRSLDSAY